jgi:hypothetical protein
MIDPTSPSPTQPQRWVTPERRHWSRDLPPATGVVGYARVRADATRVLYRLTAGAWYPVRDRNPEAIGPAPLEGYVWVEVFGRLEHVWAEHVEIRPGETEPTA